MSTEDRLKELLASGDLQEWRSNLLPVSVVRRKFYVTEEVRDQLDADPWQPSLFETRRKAAGRRVHTHMLINSFIEGQTLTVGAGKADADLKCLSPMPRVPDWRVVELRPIDGSRFTRLLGEMPAPDTFVGLKLAERKSIKDWDKLAGSADARWLQLFPGNPPLVWSAAPTARDFGKNYIDV